MCGLWLIVAQGFWTPLLLNHLLAPVPGVLHSEGVGDGAIEAEIVFFPKSDASHGCVWLEKRTAALGGDGREVVVITAIVIVRGCELLFACVH